MYQPARFTPAAEFSPTDRAVLSTMVEQTFAGDAGRQVAIAPNDPNTIQFREGKEEANFKVEGCTMAPPIKPGTKGFYHKPGQESLGL